MEHDEQQHRPRPSTAGGRLREAREAQGLSRGDIASRTKIAERHVLAIEEDRFGDLAARTYAVGFARAYARTVDLDEAEIAAAVRRQLDAQRVEPVERKPSFEPGDPARVPPRRLAWLAGGAVILAIALVLVFWSSFLTPQGRLPDLLPEETPVPVAGASVAPPPSAAPPSAGPVVLTATQEDVWVSVTDAAGTQLLQRALAKGESWTVPAEVRSPQLRTGRPDLLQLTVGGQAVPRLADRPITVSGISLIPADVLARARPAPSSPAPAASAAVPAGRTDTAREPAARPSGSSERPVEDAAPPPASTAPAVPASTPAAPPPAVPSPRASEPVSTDSG